MALLLLRSDGDGQIDHLASALPLDLQLRDFGAEALPRKCRVEVDGRMSLAWVVRAQLQDVPPSTIDPRQRDASATQVVSATMTKPEEFKVRTQTLEGVMTRPHHPDLHAATLGQGNNQVVGFRLATHHLGPTAEFPLCEHRSEHGMYRHVAGYTCLRPSGGVAGRDGQLPERFLLRVEVAEPKPRSFTVPQHR